MIVVRNVFKLKFGKAREAIAAIKEIAAVTPPASGGESGVRVLTDVTGDFYTLVLELSDKDLTAFEQRAKKTMADPQWQAAYQKLTPLVESGHREIFNVVA